MSWGAARSGPADTALRETPSSDSLPLSPDPKEATVARVINCTCGYVVRGDSDEELLAAAHKHMEESHPDLANPPSDEDLLASAQEE